MEERLLELLRMALQQHATDLHFTLRDQQLEIQMRCGLDMKEVETDREDLRLFRYLQYQADLDLSDHVHPQTGRFEMEVDGRILALRFALMYSLRMISGVLRILNGSSQWTLQDCCPDKSQIQALRKVLNQRSGLFLVSGPTGSGKTTTLYAMLNELVPLKIFTLEDPIEVYCDHFVQLQINPAQDLSYAQGIAQLLRHDPDVIMIGEIRDREAATMAVRCALTGHLVFSTIHASSVLMAYRRMVELGVDDKALNEVLQGISCQRLLTLKNRKERMCVYEVADRKQITALAENREVPDFIPLSERLDDLAEKNRITKKQREAAGQ